MKIVSSSVHTFAEVWQGAEAASYIILERATRKSGHFLHRTFDFMPLFLPRCIFRGMCFLLLVQFPFEIILIRDAIRAAGMCCRPLAMH